VLLLSGVCGDGAEGFWIVGLAQLGIIATELYCERTHDPWCLRGTAPRATFEWFMCTAAVAVQGWIQDPRSKQAKRFHRDQKSWARDPMVFVDTGLPISGEPPLLKTRVHLRREVALRLWQDLLKVGWQPVEALWGTDAEV